jgi:hypothetical protein
MSSTLLINGIWKGVAEAAFRNVVFKVGTPDQLARTELRTGQVFVGLFGGYNFTRNSIEDANEQTQNFGFTVGLLDNFEEDSNQQINCLATAEILIEQMLINLEAVGVDLGFQITGLRKSPVYKRGGESITGIWVECTVFINRCQDNSYSNLAEYIGELSNTISPYDWEGVTNNENSMRQR